MSHESQKWKPGIFYHPTPTGVGGRHRSSFKHNYVQLYILVWSVGKLSFETRFLSQETTPRGAN
ncbi:hypothetical protein [Spirosoma endophyticum]|uniref:hypothetical protein n=1 Tax=Spirosoma endophyticum TaxID=662367 RepID=UPI00116081B7|nr:hypothetical protein [Spirosoma endophyticum]